MEVIAASLSFSSCGEEVSECVNIEFVVRHSYLILSWLRGGIFLFLDSGESLDGMTSLPMSKNPAPLTVLTAPLSYMIHSWIIPV